jgi:DNA-binding NarL/FixJ family response regulator
MENGCKNLRAGIELAQNIRRINSDLPVAVYSMNIDQATRNAAIHAGVNCITVNPDELKQWLMTFVGV